MCGILGYIETKPNAGKEAKLAIPALLVASEKRGSDATGIAFINKGKIIHHKDGVPAHEFIQQEKFKLLLGAFNPNIMIGHTRTKTQGSEKNNDNNHPIIADNIALVHNGMIMNEIDVFKEFKLKRKAEVDSEIIARLISYFKKQKAVPATRVAIQCACKELRGGLAIAVINALNPRELHLVSSDNPIVTAYQKSTGTIFFGSEIGILQQALYRGNIVHNFFYNTINQDDFIFRVLEENEGIRITANKISGYKVERAVYNYQSNYSEYEGRVWDHEKNDWKWKDRKAEQQSLLPAGKKREDFVKGYNPLEVIIKPSKYKTLDLQARYTILARINKKEELTGREQTEFTRIINMIRTRTAENFDPTKAIKRPEFYTIKSIEERINALEDADTNKIIGKKEAVELDILYNYFIDNTETEYRAEKERSDTEKELQAKADKATPTTPETQQMADNIADADEHIFANPNQDYDD